MPRSRAIARKGFFGKPASSALARKVPVDGFYLSGELRPGQWYKKIGIAEIAVVFWNFVLDHEVIAERVVGEFCHQPVILIPSSSQELRAAVLSYPRPEYHPRPATERSPLDSDAKAMVTQVDTGVQLLRDGDLDGFGRLLHQAWTLEG
jgi:hypothetical protein